MAEAEEYVFVCPECRETISMNASMREAIIANGCVICGADVDADSFENASE